MASKSCTAQIGNTGVEEWACATHDRIYRWKFEEVTLSYGIRSYATPRKAGTISGVIFVEPGVSVRSTQRSQ